MGEQPGAGRTHSFKIKGHSRQRRAAKPYSRPSDRNKGVLESVRDFFSPSWLLDFWKGKNVVEEDESEDFDDENSGEEPAGISQDFGSSSRVMERAGPSTSERVSDTRQELLGNGGPGFMASAQKRSRTSQKSGLSALLALRPREPLNKKALETKTTAFASSTGEYSRSNEYTSSYMESVETKEGESLTHESRKTISESGPSPILSSSQSKPGSSLFFGARRTSTESRPSPLLSSSQSKPGPSPIFGTSLTPGASSTPVSSQPTPGPSLLSTERSSSRHQPTSVFRSKPEFSLSAFGSVLPSRSNLQTQRYSSPYYSGKTIFGGASSQASSKRARTSSPGSAEASKPVKRQIRPTPIAGTSGGGVTSQTAKRILETLERMSSPLEDAKKIPPSPPFATSSSPLSFSSKRRKAPPQPYNKPIGSPRKLQAQFGGPPVQSLSVPRRAVISRLQPKTDTTQMTSTPLPTAVTGKNPSKSTLKPIESFVPTPLPMSLSPMESTKGNGGGKMKKTKTSSAHYKSQPVDEEQQEVTNPLPVITSAIPLTIPSGTSMPSFSFPLSSTSTKTTSSKTDSDLSSFNSNSPDIPSNNFKFSAPEPRISSNKTSSNLTNHQKINYSFSKPASVINSENNTSSSAKSPASNSFDKFKPAEGSWECSTCMVNNKPQELSCVACSTPQPPPTKPMETTTKSLSTKQTSNDLFKQFQPPSGSWTCSSCMLTNKQQDQKCIACETPSTTDKQKPELVQPKNTLLKQFAAASDSWECPDCMLINKAQDLQCVACQAKKPGEKSSKTTDNSLSKQFTPAEGSWTCDTCMIVNKSDAVKCIACETSKPGSSTKPSSFTSGFKVSSENKFHNSPFKFVPVDNKDSRKAIFGGSSSSSSDPFKMAATSISTTPFAFGASTTSSSSETSFTFGSTTTTSSKVQFGSTDSSNFKFGSSEESTKLKPTFQFGKGTESKSTDAATTFKFGSTSDSTAKQPTFAFGSTAKSDKPENPFTFGGNRIDAKNPTVTKESPKKPAAQEPLKAGSIAQAAAAGLLKIPSSTVDVVDLTSDVSKPDLPKETIEAVAPPNVNLFGKSIASPAKPISLPKATEAKPQATASLAPLPFAFGAPPSVTKPEEDPAKAIPSFAFQPSTTDSSTIPKFGELTSPAVTTSAPIQGFQFGSSINSKTTATGGGAQLGFTGPPQQGNVLTGFSNATKNTTTASPFVFKGTGDSTENKLSTSSTAFGFVPHSGNGGFSFGGTSKSSTTSESPAPFVFGAVETQKQSGFTFGSSSQQPFAFGSSNANPQASAPSTVSEESMDADGNNNNNQPPVPLFGSTLAPATQTAAPFSFTAAPANAGFNFGNVQQPASFKFGDSSSNPPIFGGSSAPAFGATTGNPVQQGASSGFNFGTPTTNNTGAQSGGFNFSGGSSSAFTAGTGTATRRVIKRGIRRTRK